VSERREIELVYNPPGTTQLYITGTSMNSYACNSGGTNNAFTTTGNTKLFDLSGSGILLYIFLNSNEKPTGYLLYLNLNNLNWVLYLPRPNFHIPILD
jgi:hypothetical protein